MITLDTNHAMAGCPCTEFTRVLSFDRPIEATIRVRACTEWFGRRPIRDALDVLSRHTGMTFIDKEQAMSLVGLYSDEPPGVILNDIEPLIEAGFGRTYYVRRDVLKQCSRYGAPKCSLCGTRKCAEPSHKDFQFEMKVFCRETSGEVYVLLHEPTQFVKVGFSSQSRKRIQTHRASIPGNLTLIGVFPGGRAVERGIHEQLCDWLVPGYQEWFFYSPFVREYLSRFAQFRLGNSQPSSTRPVGSE